MITITPQTLQETVLAWLGTATILLGAVAGFVSLAMAKFAAIRAENAARQSEANHAVSTANIATLQTAMNTIALATPLGNGNSPAQVEVVNPPSAPVPTIEKK